MKKVISIPNAPAPIGPYSQAILKDNTLYVSGQIPIDSSTGAMKTATIAEATKQVLENIKALVETAGFSMKDVIKCSIFLQSLTDFKIVNEIYATYFKDIPPARETVEVARLPKNSPIEISCIAVR